MDALTKVLVSLYEEPEKPDDALEYPFKIYSWYIHIIIYRNFNDIISSNFYCKIIS